ncbi:cell wall metabolism sensor histidine kinase WalK [Sporomusa malonica]|nr:cell wall metabolism sensor histidine kinase WalK [Sporomusa malonica]
MIRVSIAKEIIAAHGGHIWAEIQPGAGMAVY